MNWPLVKRVATTHRRRMNYRKQLAARLKAARESAKLSQAQVSQELGVSVGSVAGYEQGAREVPDAFIEAAAGLYGTHPALLRYGMDVLRLAASAATESALRDAARMLVEHADAIAAGRSDDVQVVTQVAREVLAPTPPAAQSPRPDTGRADRRTARLPRGSDTE